MIRRVIYIDKEKCTGCGICADACHEGAIEIIHQKAVLVRDDYCDGLGDCLPTCPTGAITFEEREAAEYDEAAVLARKAEKAKANKSFNPKEKRESMLMQWPTQIKLMPLTAPYYQDAKLLIAADCTAFAYASMHEDLMAGHVTINGCPKLDACDYSDKLHKIFALNDISEVTLVRMEVPCCGGLEMAAKKALSLCGKDIPFKVVVISVNGEIIKDERY